ncbi:MAG: hypothetical protein JWQ30_1119 [Sediminibacterium sp.]|nr:hypothetical protein [Sediminibacterium sp.]
MIAGSRRNLFPLYRKLHTEIYLQHQSLNMKKILMGMLALTLISGSAAFASDKTKKAKKAKTATECKASDCKDKKDCKDMKDCTKPCKPSSCGK